VPRTPRFTFHGNIKVTGGSDQLGTGKTEFQTRLYTPRYLLIAGVAVTLQPVDQSCGEEVFGVPAHVETFRAPVAVPQHGGFLGREQRVLELARLHVHLLQWTPVGVGQIQVDLL
jgi:hypothetical protein